MEAIPTAFAPPAIPNEVQAPIASLEMILHGKDEFTTKLAQDRDVPEMVQSLLVMSLLGLGVHGVLLGAAAQWLDLNGALFANQGHPVVWMPLAYMLACLGSLAVCLPTLYLLVQRTGADLSLRLVTALALRAQAVSATLLLGAAPFFGALILAQASKLLPDGDLIALAGIALPAVTGLFGCRDLYARVTELEKKLPLPDRLPSQSHLGLGSQEPENQGKSFGRLVLAWSALYAAVAPAAMFRLAEALSQRI